MSPSFAARQVVAPHLKVDTRRQAMGAQEIQRNQACLRRIDRTNGDDLAPQIGYALDGRVGPYDDHIVSQRAAARLMARGMGAQTPKH